MKVFISILLTIPWITGCMLLPKPPSPTSRKFPPVVSDLDNLEMLLQNEPISDFSTSGTQSGIESLRLGMKKSNVQMQLGRPNLVEVAGNPKYGYERWTYETAIPTMSGYMTERQVIYFEQGQVVGWESE
jgi:hypothetical protein